MKSFLLVLLTALLLVTNVFAVGFRVEFTNKFAPDKVSTNVLSSIQIYMNNGASPLDGPRWGFSMPLMIYGDADIQWVDVGGPTIEEYPDYFPFHYDTHGALIAYGNFGRVSEWFSGVNRISVFSAESWDSNLPDTFNSTLYGSPYFGNGAWPTDLGELLAYEMFFNTGPNEGQICIDSIAHSNPIYDWLWLPPSGPFGGPYCVNVVDGPMPPTISNCPTDPIDMQWDEQVSRVFNVDLADGASITDAESNIGTVEITGPSQVTWTYNPTCDDIGQYSVEICVADEVYSCPNINSCKFDINVQNTAPEFVNCPATIPTPNAGTSRYVLNIDDANDGDAVILSIENVMPNPIGSDISLSGDTVIFAADIADDGTSFEVQIKATDCAGESSYCTLIYILVSISNQIKIEYTDNVVQGHYQSVAVSKEYGNFDYYGFDFLMAYDASALTLMGALPGDLFDSDGSFRWEYFTYRFGPFGNCGNACPSGLVRVVGMAETNDGANHPLDYTIPDGTALFHLNFLVSNDRTLECQFVPIKFYWIDCGDNTMAYHSPTDFDPMSISTAVSKRVYNYVGPQYQEITDESTGFPTFTGFQPNNCPPEPNKPPAMQNIDFYNGGIQIICADDIDARGDINLNGIANEIADAVVFVNYFVYGLAAFTVNVEGQIAATDVNADGLTLSVADLVYLIRVITGDALPYDKLAPDAETARFMMTDGIISTDHELGAVYFEFDGAKDLHLAPSAQDMKLDYNFDGSKTRAMIYSFKMNRTCSGDLLISDAAPAKIEAVDYFGNSYKTEFVQTPQSFTMTVYPNPFNSVATVQFDLPANTQWTYRIFNIAGQTVFETSGKSVGTTNEIRWEANDMATGIYFGTLYFEGQKVVEKMILLK